ncbi:MAG: undecaprenyl-diphosphate phosphatase [Bacteroidales bacterium]|nr:undecaprenyl-diphosphate phosphatase [Bacteroidales bacterium]
MNWWQAIILGMVQGLTEFLPVSSSGHLMIARELLGVDASNFLDFTVTVHLATVISTIIVFWSAIMQIIKGVFKFKYNDETDYFLKLCVSMIPVAVVGFFFKDKVEALFGETLTTVGICLLVTAALLLFATLYSPRKAGNHRNGIAWWQAFVVGIGQALAVAPGLSRSGTTIATGLVTGVKKDSMAQFSFLMVLVPILGEQFLSIVDVLQGEATMGLGALPLILGFLAAFASGLFACKVMIAIVRKAKFSWFALYCAVVGILVLILGR